MTTSNKVPSSGILAIVSAADGAVVAAIHDRTDMSMAVICSAHKRHHTIRYTHGTTEAEREWCRKDIEYTAALHAADHDDTNRPGHEGGQS